VFFDDIEVVKDSEAWNRRFVLTPEDEEYCRWVGGGQAYDSCTAIQSLVARERATAELDTRIRAYQGISSEEKVRVEPGICVDLNEQVYISGLQLIQSDPEQAYVPIWQYAWGEHYAHLRLYLTTECAEHVPYEPYPEPPDLDCANYDYQEDAEEDAWTYWYSEDAQEMRVSREIHPLRLACAYLPSRR
jgi:hypothetical protein